MKPYFDSFLKIIGQDYFTFSSSVLPKKFILYVYRKMLNFIKICILKKKFL